MNSESWRLVVAASAERSLNRLPSKVASAVVEFMLGPLLDSPHRVGHRLERELSGLRSARRGVYRIIYEIDEDEMVVGVIRIEHSADVYRSR